MHQIVFPSGCRTGVLWYGILTRTLSARWPQRSLSPGTHTLPWLYLTLYQSWSVWPIEYGRNNDTAFLRLEFKRHCSLLSLPLSLAHEQWAVIFHVMSSPMERPTSQENETFYKQSCEWAWKWVLQSHSSLQMTVWLWPHESHWTRTTQLSLAWIPDPQELCKKTPICCFKPLSLSTTPFWVNSNPALQSSAQIS